MTTRCEWAGDNPLYIAYHDREWGAPVHDDRMIFEFLTLEGAQAGLSRITILKKRDNYRQAFDGFDPGLIAAYDEDKVQELLANPGIVRNRRGFRFVSPTICYAHMQATGMVNDHTVDCSRYRELS